MTFNWTKFEKQVFIKAAGQDVFSAWAIPEEIIRWFITVQVEEQADGYTKLSLIQENMPDTPYGRHYHLSCNLGWSFIMTSLKRSLEHGIDLREKKPDRVDTARAISVS